MKLRTSFINRGILLNDLKRFSWIGAGYLLALLAIVPLKIFMLYSRTQDLRTNDTTAYLRIFQFDYYSPIQILVLIVVPVLTGLLLFRYLQDSRAADMAHALPVRREALYNTHVVTGIIFLFVPLILTALVSWALVSGLGIEDVKGINILTWLANCLLFNLLFFICSMAETMVLALEQRYESYTLGRELTVEQVEEIAQLAGKHGFKLSGFRSFGKALTEKEIAGIKSRASERKTARPCQIK
jgi:ABC-2 type transport system permease protein